MGRADGGGPAPVAVVVPQSFRDMPRWWREGTGWLEALPRLVRAYCDRWQLAVTGGMAHGSNAAVVPVVRAGEFLVLRLTPPGAAVAAQVEALRFWDGRGTVRLIDADVEGGVMLLERLAMDASLEGLPVAEAMPLLGRMMRRLAVPAPEHVPRTVDVVAARMPALPGEWERCGRPFPESTLVRAFEAGERLSRTESRLAVNGDLHSGQVLRGEREPWLTVDPVLMRGDIAYDLARILWTRIDEMDDEGDILRHFRSMADAAGVDRDHGRDWVVFRAVDYWLWGLTAGLTEDPQRCRRLLAPLARR
ncbi:aminoglycoside phosphotransferase family protein [Paractinoplanes toevensis]|uniref:Aminoglycoside O-phosphotransferase n=1 Tax=Paractinoplanes toevensis TaxID=571911 RepID=A0A919W7A0_9ACTN|nr:aminoglycoside phosphotransferase family protein [Actinoplanes toevensis]GIM88641.1 aminoglycoside O-phosphotransferase [Actinoplanes toevensis]